MTGVGRGWKCAVCGLLISSIEDGWVEWLTHEPKRGTTTASGLRLVHQLAVSPRSSSRGCHYDYRREYRKSRNIVEGLALASFVGPDGLMLLLSLVVGGELPIEELLELIKRVQIPGYEQSRELLQEEIDKGALSPAIAQGYYLQSEIRAALGRALPMVKHG